jgi:hypothetical protein
MFDPYYKWLGIPPKDQPPNHYRLLGIELFESDADVIDAAANKQMAYIQGCATGPHIALSQRLLNEIAVARLCLLTPAKKAKYDAKLKANVPSVPLAKPVGTAASVSSEQGAIPADSPAPVSPKPLQDKPDLFDGLESEPDVGILKHKKHRSQKWPVILGCATLGVIGVVIVGVYSLGGANPKTDKPHAKDAKTLPLPEVPKNVKKDTASSPDQPKKQPQLGQWIDLLKLVKLPDNALRGVAVLDSGNLVLQEFAQVELPVSDAGHYDLELSFTRIKSGDTVCVIMPVVGQSFQFWMDFFGEVGGLSTKENIDPRFNKAKVIPKRLETGKKYTLAIQVRTLADSRASLKATLNNDTYLVWEGESSQLTTSHMWKQPSKGAFAIGVGSGSTVQFHAIQMRAVDPDQKVEKPAPPSDQLTKKTPGPKTPEPATEDDDDSPAEAAIKESIFILESRKKRAEAGVEQDKIAKAIAELGKLLPKGSPVVKVKSGEIKPITGPDVTSFDAISEAVTFLEGRKERVEERADKAKIATAMAALEKLLPKKK